MTEERFEEIVKIKEQIDKLEMNLNTIEYLINSSDLKIEVTGVSTCKFRVHRHLYLTEQDVIKNSLLLEKSSLIERIDKLNKKFEEL